MRIPKVIYIETTNLCNADCIMCPHKKMKRSPGIMSDEIFKKTVDDCEAMKLTAGQVFLHKEGEPLLDPDIFERIHYVRSKLPAGVEVGINTNAMLLTKERAEKLLKSGVNTVYFSVDGVDKISYESIRINLNYETVFHNIVGFFELKEKMNSDVRVIMQMLITDDHGDEENKFRDIWGKYPCEFYIKKMHSYLDGGHSSLTECLSAEQTKVCDDPFRLVVVYQDGNVGMCCWDYDNEYNIGNVKEQKLYEIFNNKRAEYMRDIQSQMKCKLINPCSRCARVFGRDEITKY